MNQPSTTSPLTPRMSARHDAFVAARPPGAEEDVHMLPVVVDEVIARCSAPGDVVFDPFAGFGTTLERAVAAGRAAIGIELLPERVESITERTPAAQIVEGDARDLVRVLREAAPSDRASTVDLVVTSPPYMTAADHDADPLTAYEKAGGDYHRYLRELGFVAAQCAHLLAPGGYAVWNVADIRYRGRTTPLIEDCRALLAEHLAFVGVTEIVWDRYPHDLVADALLVFQKPPHDSAAE